MNFIKKNKYLFLLRPDLIGASDGLKPFGRRASIILFLLILLYTLYFSWFTFNRHDNLYSMRYDLGNMDQTVWNTSQGRIFTFTNPVGNSTISRLAIHTDVFLILLAPLYWIIPNVKVLLFVQSLILAIGAVPIYLISKKATNSNGISLVFALSYLLYPPMQRANIYEFHAVTLATTFLLFSFYFAYLKNYFWFVFFAFLAATTKEEIPLIIAGMGIYILVKNKDKLVGVITIIISLLWFILAVWAVIPHYRLGAQHFAITFFSEYGESPGKVLIGLIQKPSKILSSILSWDKLTYLFQLLFPVGFLAILSLPIFFISLPELAINLLSNSAPMHSIFYQYTSGITPFVFISAIFGSAFLIKKVKVNKKIIIGYLLLWVILGSYLYSPLPYSKSADFNSIYFPSKYKDEVSKIAKIISSKYSVSVSNSVAPHFTQRENAYVFPTNFDSADFSIVLAEGNYESLPAFDIKNYVERLKVNKNYTLFYNAGNFYVFKRVGIK